MHECSFTPSISLYVDFSSEDGITVTFNKLTDRGAVKMPPGNYGFSEQVAWIEDRFGVSWQLNLSSIAAG